MDDDPNDDEPGELRPTPASEWRYPDGLSTFERLQLRSQARRAIEIEIDLGPGFAAFADGMRKQSEQLTRMLGPALEATTQMYRGVAERMAPVLASLATEMRRRLPPNWHPEDFDAALELAGAGWPIVWAPNADIVHALITADDDQRRTILEQNADAILDDLSAVLADVEPDDTELISLVTQAIAAARHGLWLVTQTAAAAALETLVGYRSRLKNQLAEVPGLYQSEEMTLRHLRLILILQGLPDAYQRFWPERGDPVPTTFSRHATAHHASGAQLTRANALFALLLTVGILRELEEHADDPVSVGGIVIRTRTAEPGR